MKATLISIICVCLCLLIIDIILLIKNKNTFCNHIKIGNAIHRYQRYAISNDEKILVAYSDVEDYDKTLYRIWDWGYKRILPKEKYNIIKEYIEE